MSTNEVFLIFPHQLFDTLPTPCQGMPIILIEEYLFFKHIPFHKQKIAFHRASMKAYEANLKLLNKQVTYINAKDPEADCRQLIKKLYQDEINSIHTYSPYDNWLQKRLTGSCQSLQIELTFHASPYFINSERENEQYFENKKRFFHADFYVYQRKKLNILIDQKGQPLGGKWSFDEENRLKYPKDKNPPHLNFFYSNQFILEANTYTENNFPNNPGTLQNEWQYPCTSKESKIWLQNFLKERFHLFGPYEDAIVYKADILHHSLLSPLLNAGLLAPLETVHIILEFGEAHQIPLNSQEGLIRQIIGWREFIYAIYQLKGSEMRQKNHWNNHRIIPSTFWLGNTGLLPIDITIKKVLKTAYCHHIERLMVLGNFMLLCEFHPEEVYKWFSCFFIDAYDWVMVPNVYGMSQFADGGLMATKPYISGSNYLLKMSDYPKGDWQITWDALFWHFMNKNRQFFLSNPRLGMLISAFDKMPIDKQNIHLNHAQNWFSHLDQTN